jgi:hypothetical protein
VFTCKRNDQVSPNAAKVPPLPYVIDGLDGQGGVLQQLKVLDAGDTNTRDAHTVCHDLQRWCDVHPIQHILKDAWKIIIWALLRPWC